MPISATYNLTPTRPIVIVYNPLTATRPNPQYTIRYGSTQLDTIIPLGIAHLH